MVKDKHLLFRTIVLVRWLKVRSASSQALQVIVDLSSHLLRGIAGPGEKPHDFCNKK
jgi:hypothetical protein